MPISPRPRLVIFGCGYVGTALAVQGLQRGWVVQALTRNATAACVLSAQGVQVAQNDLESFDWHVTLPPGADFVVNCVSSGGAGLEGYRQSYLRGTESILAWARGAARCSSFLYTSSTSVYPQAHGLLVDEESSTSVSSERAKLLIETEDLIRQSDLFGRWFLLRLAGIYGPGRHHLIEQVKAGQIAGVGTHRLNLAHRDDIVAAILNCLLAPDDVRNEIFNVADDTPSSKESVVAWLAEELGVEKPNFTGEPAAGRRAITPDRVIVNAKLKRLLGWQPRYPDFRAGYRAILSG